MGNAYESAAALAVRTELDTLIELLNLDGAGAVARYMAGMGYPTDNATAEALWHLLSSNRLPEALARVVYETAGYVPFSGFPLTRLPTNGG